MIRLRRYYGRVVTLIKNERFKLFDWEEVFYIADTLKSKKTLEDFKNELMIEWKEELAIGETDEESIEEMANEKYQEYLYENSLDGKEIVDKLNELFDENERLKNKLNTTALELVGECISMGKAVEISEMSYREFIDYRAENGKPMELQL